MFDDIKNYLKEESGYDNIKSDLKDFLNFKIENKSPICILSHLYDKRRSKFIVDIMKELDEGLSIDREVFLFIYDSQKSHYSFLKNYPSLKPIWIEENENTNSLTKKRNYVLNFASKKYSNIFIIEDDTTKYFLPIKAKTISSGVHKNNKFQLSINSAFALWDYYIQKYKLIYSAPLIESSFIWLNYDNFDSTLRYNYTCIQSIHLNIDYLDEKKIRYDLNSGWDDFDLNLQIVTSGEKTCLVPLGYHTVSLKSGMSTIENSKLEERCERSSNLFVKKWGSDLTRIENKRGLVNARINWRFIKKNNFNKDDKPENKIQKNNFYTLF